MIAIIDYGVGNLFSLRSSLGFIGAEAKVTSDPEEIKNADKLILPGVGAFADAALKLKESGLDIVIKEEAARGKRGRHRRREGRAGAGGASRVRHAARMG